MSAAPLIPQRDIPTVNVVEIQNGRRIALADITSAAQGRAIMDELDADIINVEDQISSCTIPAVHSEWRRRAERALRIKKRIRNTLQERIGALRRAEKAAADAAERVAAYGVKAVQVDAKRKAFVHAAYQMIGHEACTEIWARAAEMKPEVFAESGGPSQ